MSPSLEPNVALALARFRERMRLIREDRQWSQAEAARRAGIDASEWNRIERGGVVPSLQSVLRIHHALQLDSMEALFGDLPVTALLRGADEGEAMQNMLRSKRQNQPRTGG
jgi:transcriptional regulator with XRE-family HTH domain